MLYGEFSLHQAAVLFKLIRPGDTVLDIGANVGAMALPMMHAVGPAGCVHAFEPQLPLARALHATLALNAAHPRNFVVHNVGLGREPGTMHVPPVDYDAPHNNFGCVELAAQGDAPVRITVLDHMDLPRVRLIKVDVEGMERDVIAGARRLLAQDRPILLVENDRKAQYLDLIADITALGYECYWFVTRLFNPENFKRQAYDIYPPDCGSIDMLCFPEGEPLPDFLTGLPQATEENAAGFTFAR
jgi:FkbM family methyltransferase